MLRLWGSTGSSLQGSTIRSSILSLFEKNQQKQQKTQIGTRNLQST